MRKQKVLIVHNYYQIPGGEDAVVENERNLLLDNGHEVVLYTRHNDEIKSRRILGKLLLPFETIFSFKTYKEVKKKIRTEKIDIVHVHNTLPLVSPSVYYAARHCKVPVVQTIHNFRLLCPGATLARDNNICEECIEKSLISAIKHRCYRGSIKHSLIVVITLGVHRLIGTYKKIDRYISLTEFNKNKIANLVDDTKIFVKPNFVYDKKEKFEYENCEYFLYIGRIDKTKGVEFLLNSWKELKEYKLIIAGSGPYEKEAHEFIKKNGLNNVIMLGHVSKEEVNKLIDKCRAVVVTSQWYEPFGMVVIEAFERGKTVVAGNIGALSSIVIDSYNGILFEYNNKDEFIEKINTLQSDELVYNLSKAARESYTKNYNESINYQMILKIYKDLGKGDVHE